jgi:hypothetical protein
MPHLTNEQLLAAYFAETRARVLVRYRQVIRERGL